MSRESLERFQVLVYLAAIVAGLAVGTSMPAAAGTLGAALWPLLAALLYATFTQVPLAHLRKAFADTRFLLAATLGNFVVIPVLVWGLMALVPDDPALRLGVLLVLLVPCTDWFITFTHLGGGDTRRAIAFSPVSLLLQILLLPAYLWLFLDGEFAASLARGEMLYAFAGLILLPLLAAYLTEKWVDAGAGRARVLDRLAWWPVPLLGLVVFVIAASQVGAIIASTTYLGVLFVLFCAFLVAAALLARLVAGLLRLPLAQGRTLAFSFGTRNSFVVLPVALALPAAYETAVIVIVFQSLVELFGMVVYLWWVPRHLFPDQAVLEAPSSEA